uniref:Immunoglobulin domain-containing protein n=1 Tax=Cyprinus carpio TaxID=7962 RepID=A0A8C2C246_CYPCA
MKSTFKIVEVLLLLCGVFGADEDEVKSVSVMEGDSVTLNPDPDKIQGFILILWRFGDPVIAQINGKVTFYPSYTEIFRGRLQLDQTGFLTINNMRIKHSGLYKIEVLQRAGTSNMKFTVTVYESPSAVDAGVTDMRLMSVKEGDPVILQTDVPQLTGDELIVWRFGDEGRLIAKHDMETKIPPLYDETDERLRDRLQLNHQTGSLTITNTRTTDSGHYKVKISSNKQTIYQKYIVTVSEPGLSPAAVAGIVVAGIVVVVLLVAAAAIGWIYHRQTIAEMPEIVSGVEGEDVELNTGVTKIQTSDLIEWKGNKDNLIAQIKGGTVDITSYEDVLHGIFRDRLKLDMETGSLTITNPRIEHTGPYKLLINEKCKKKFIVYIKGKTLTVKENDSVTLETKTEIQNGDEIRWMFGDKDTLIAEIKVEARGMTTHEGPDGRFRDRLELVEANGSLTIKNITADHAGLYKLLILSKGSTLCSKFFIYVGGEYLKSLNVITITVLPHAFCCSVSAVNSAQT